MATTDDIERVLQTVGELRGEMLTLKAQNRWLQDRLDVLEYREKRRQKAVKERAKVYRRAPMGLTKKDVQALREIRDFWAAHRRGPSYAELAGLLGIGSGGACERVKRLRRMELVSRNPKGKGFAIRALWDPDAAELESAVA